MFPDSLHVRYNIRYYLIINMRFLINYFSLLRFSPLKTIFWNLKIYEKSTAKKQGSKPIVVIEGKTWIKPNY